MIFTLVTVFFGLSAQAQTLQETLNSAEADYRVSSQNFQDQIANSSKYLPCDLERSELNQKYADWYRRNARAIYAKFDEVQNLFDYVDGKIQVLQGMQFNALAVEGQTESRNISFGQIVSYLADLNVRAQNSQNAGQYEAFKRQLSNPAYNPFHLTTDQIVAAAKNLAVQMNASLKERGVDFEVVYLEKTVGFSLNLKINYPEFHQYQQLDLLVADRQTVALSSSDKWSLISNVKIDGHSINPNLRYNEFLNDVVSGECFYVAEELFPDTPYLSLKQLEDVSLAKSKKSGIHFNAAFRRLTRSAVCTFGGDGKIQFKDGRSKILNWATGVPAQNADWNPLKIENEKILVNWGGNYILWVRISADYQVTSSQGNTTCTFD